MLGGSVVHLRLQVVLQADLVDQAQLGFQPVDMFFLGLEDVFQQAAALKKQEIEKENIM